MSLSKILLFFIFITPSLALTQEGYSPYFRVKAEALYLEPIFENRFIPTPNPNGQNPFTLQPTGPGKKNKFDYTTSWRIDLSYTNPGSCFFIKNGSLRFTYLSTDHARKIDLNAFLSSLLVSSDCQTEETQFNFLGCIHAKHTLDYYATDLWTDFPIFYMDCFRFSIQPGFHYAFMKYHNHVHLSVKNKVLFPSAHVKEHSQSWGIGPELGFRGHYHINRWMVVQGEVIGGLLISRASARFKMDPFSSNHVDDSHRFNPKVLWKIFPFWETRIGVISSFTMMNHLVEIEIGYLYLTYPNFINLIQYPSNRSSKRADNVFSKIDFQGPYFSMAIDF